MKKNKKGGQKRLINNTNHNDMPKVKYQKKGATVTAASFMWVLGFGYKKDVYNHDGESRSVVRQWILPFCAIESITNYKKTITL